MAEEFQEFEVVFGENNSTGNARNDFGSSRFGRRGDVGKTKRSSSRPVNIPEGKPLWPRCETADLEHWEDGEFVPPHVITGQRRMTSFSVCTGNGRTLKGRDLCAVRNSVLRMTGFLET